MLAGHPLESFQLCTPPYLVLVDRSYVVLHAQGEASHHHSFPTTSTWLPNHSAPCHDAYFIVLHAKGDAGQGLVHHLADPRRRAIEVLDAVQDGLHGVHHEAQEVLGVHHLQASTGAPFSLLYRQLLIRTVAIAMQLRSKYWHVLSRIVAIVYWALFQLLELGGDPQVALEKLP
jgi:hypothetical protein